MTVMEAASEVGGRIRTDEIDGFLVTTDSRCSTPLIPRSSDGSTWTHSTFNPSAPVRSYAVRTGSRSWPTPGARPNLLATPCGAASFARARIAALVRWLGPTLVSPRRTLRDSDEALGASLDRAGVTGAFRREVLQPFLAGVSVDSHEQTSANLSKLLMRMFALGRARIAEAGMRALPEQLAAVGAGRWRGRRPRHVRRQDHQHGAGSARALRRPHHGGRSDRDRRRPGDGKRVGRPAGADDEGPEHVVVRRRRGTHDLPLIAVDGRRSGQPRRARSGMRP